MDIVKVQTVSVTIAASASSGTGALSGFTTAAKIVPFSMSWRVADGQSPVLASNTELDVVVDSLSQITVSRYSSPAYAINVRVCVVELGSGDTVQSGTFSMTDAETTATAAVSSLTLANSFWVMYHKNEGEVAPGNDSDPDGRLVSCKFNSTTQLGFQRGLAKGALSGHWYTVSSNDLSVQHVTHSNSSAVLTTTDTISSVTLANTFLICSQRDTDVQYQDNACWDPYLKNTTTVEWRRGFASTNTSTFEYQVISDSSIIVQRNTFTATGTTDNDTISAVGLTYSIAKPAFGRSGMTGSDAYADGTMDGRYWELWLNSTTQINGQSSEGNDFTWMSWEVVELLIVNYKIEGVTYDKNESALANCNLLLIKDNQDDTFTVVDHTTSDGSGNYLFENIPDTDPQYQVYAWKDDSPHVMDVTDHVLLPKQTPTESYDLYLRSDTDKGETSPDKDLRLRSDADKIADDVWDNTDCVFALHFNAWSKCNGTVNKYTGNMPSYPLGAFQDCVLTNFSSGYGYIYNSGDGYCLFENNDDYILTEYPLLLTNASKFTIELFANRKTNGVNEVFCGLEDDSANYFLFFLNATNNVVANITINSTTYLVQSSTTIAVGLHHFVFIKDGGTLKLYVDGTECSYTIQNTYNYGDFNYGRSMLIGADALIPAYGFNDKVYWYGIYDDAISEARIITNEGLGTDLGLFGTNDGDTMYLGDACVSLFFGQHAVNRGVSSGVMVGVG